MGVDADTPLRARSSKGERTRARLLGAAKTVFEEHGFTEARISDIAEQAELSHGAFYHYFASKEEIFRELAAVHERAMGAAVEAEVGSVTAATPDGLLAARLRAATRSFLARYRDEVRLMRVIEQVARHDAELASARLADQARDAARLAHAVADVQRRGLADGAVDPVLGAHLVAAMVTRFAEVWFGQERLRCPFGEGVGQLDRLCLNALGLPSPDPG